MQKEPSPASHIQGLSILLVDDCQDSQLLFKRLLPRAGAHLERACDGHEGLQKARQKHFDLILMDLQMPTLDGFITTFAMRKGGIRVPIIALTAHARIEDKEKALAWGCDAHMSKPIDFPFLIETLEQWINGSYQLASKNENEWIQDKELPLSDL